MGGESRQICGERLSMNRDWIKPIMILNNKSCLLSLGKVCINDGATM